MISLLAFLALWGIAIACISIGVLLSWHCQGGNTRQCKRYSSWRVLPYYNEPRPTFEIEEAPRFNQPLSNES